MAEAVLACSILRCSSGYADALQSMHLKHISCAWAAISLNRFLQSRRLKSSVWAQPAEPGLCSGAAGAGIEINDRSAAKGWREAGECLPDRNNNAPCVTGASCVWDQL